MSGSANPVSSVLTPFVFADEKAYRGLGGADSMPVGGK
jgi:hypothetical protein